MTSTARFARQGRMNGLGEETLLSVEELMRVEADLRDSPLKNAFDGAEYDAQAILKDVRGGSLSYLSSSPSTSASSSAQRGGNPSSLTVRERQHRDSFVKKSLKHEQFRAEHHKSVLSSILASAEAVEDRKAQEVLSSVPWPQDFKEDASVGRNRLESHPEHKESEEDIKTNFALMHINLLQVAQDARLQKEDKRQEVRDLKAEIKRLRTELKIAHQRVEIRDSNLELLQSKCARLSEELVDERRARHEAERKRDELFLQVGNLKPSHDFLSSELDKVKSERESAEATLIDSFRRAAEKEGIKHVRAETWYQGTM